MAEDRTPDPADEPEDDETTPRENPPEPYRLGGSGGSGKSPDDPSGKSGDEPGNPFEAFFSSSRRDIACLIRPGQLWHSCADISLPQV